EPEGELVEPAYPICASSRISRDFNIGESANDRPRANSGSNLICGVVIVYGSSSRPGRRLQVVEQRRTGPSPLPNFTPAGITLRTGRSQECRRELNPRDERHPSCLDRGDGAQVFGDLGEIPSWDTWS